MHLFVSAFCVITTLSTAALAQYLPDPNNVPNQYIPSVSAPNNQASSAWPQTAPTTTDVAPSPESTQTLPGTLPQMAPQSGGTVQPFGQPAATPVTPQTVTPAPIPMATDQPAPRLNVTPDSDIYITGGVGLREHQYFESVQKDYNLKITFAGKESEFLAAVNVLITDKSGATMVTAVTKGPLMLVKLKPGTYKIEAEKNGVRKSMTVTTGKGLTSKTIVL